MMTENRYHFEVPESKKIRLIINTDAKNEADDQYAIVHRIVDASLPYQGDYRRAVRHPPHHQLHAGKATRKFKKY